MILNENGSTSSLDGLCQIAPAACNKERGCSSKSCLLSSSGTKGSGLSRRSLSVQMRIAVVWFGPELVQSLRFLYLSKTLLRARTSSWHMRAFFSVRVVQRCCRLGWRIQVGEWELVCSNRWQAHSTSPLIFPQLLVPIYSVSCYSGASGGRPANVYPIWTSPHRCARKSPACYSAISSLSTTADATLKSLPGYYQHGPHPSTLSSRLSL